MELARLKVEGKATKNLHIVSFANVTSNTLSTESCVLHDPVMTGHEDVSCKCY